MAVRARLTPPREVQQEWPWHKAKTTSLRASLMFGGDRRMEAESYLTDGFAIRTAIQKQNSGWYPLSAIADIYQPSRLKGINVQPELGAPYLTATQVFDLRPIPRRWLSLDKLPNKDELTVEDGQILVTRSGTVGRSTLAYEAHRNTIVSDDLLRIRIKDTRNWGWIFAFLRSSMAQKAMTSLHYGHVIKHLEVGHLEELPIINIRNQKNDYFNSKAMEIVEKRNEAFVLQDEAEQILSDATGVATWGDTKSTRYVKARLSNLNSGRRRLEAAYYAPQVCYIVDCFAAKGLHVGPMSEVTKRLWWMARFSRYFGHDGVEYKSSDDLFSISPLKKKFIHVNQIQNWCQFLVSDGWVLMACSGQVYGLNGSVALATKEDENTFFSHDLIRIQPDLNKVRPGYLFTYLGHPDIGQPLVIRNAYGSSVPHLEPADVEDTPIARLDRNIEDEVADLAEKASKLRSEANAIESTIGKEADAVIAEFTGIQDS